MTEFLKGNYTLETKIEEPGKGDAPDSTEEFERKALARLGGSICFVRRKGFLWMGDTADGPGTPDRQPPR